MAATIVMAGDSLTAAGDWAAWLPDYEVTNAGIPGDRTDDLIARLDDIVEGTPDAVVVLVGTNDLAWRAAPEDVGRNLETILVELRKRLPDGRILVTGVLPREADYAARIRSINTHVRQFAATVHAQFLDLWPAFADDDGALAAEFSEDGLHLTDAGYRAWTDELGPALETLFATPPTTRSIPVVGA